MGLAADAYARMLTALLPPGRLWRRVDGILGKLLLASADELARLDARVDDLIEEADPRTATELLPEYVRELDLRAHRRPARRTPALPPGRLPSRARAATRPGCR